MFKKRSREDITRLIRQSGQTAMEARQVWRRLNRLLPSRLRLLQEQQPSFGRRGGRQRALLEALVHPNYIEHVDEMIATSALARRSRVEYETGLMLLEAERTLRRLRLSPLR